MKRAFKDQTGKIVVIDGDLPSIEREIVKEEVIDLQLVKTKTRMPDEEYDAKMKKQEDIFIENTLANLGSLGDKTVWEELDVETMKNPSEAAPAEITLNDLMAGVGS